MLRSCWTAATRQQGRLARSSGGLTKRRPLALSNRYFSAAEGDDEALRDGNRSMMHFRTTPQGHPLNIQKSTTAQYSPGGDIVWENPTQNHVWSESELAERLSDQPKHKPDGLLDRTIWLTVR
eukprot:COSAG02_NODE_38490_length_428_cov_1.091185_1_plen_122_part_10